MLTNLGYYGPKANTHLTASILSSQFFTPFTPYFVATGPKPKRTMDPEEEQYLGRDFKRIWRSSEGMREVWVSCSAEPWGSNSWCELS